MEARTACGSWKFQFEKASAQREQARAELKALQHSRKDVSRLEVEVARLKRLLAAAKIDASKRDCFTSLRMKYGVLKAKNQSLREMIKALDARVETLESSRANMARKTYGKTSEKTGKQTDEKTRPKRKRGQQPGARGHGRTPRATLEERVERHELSDEERVCPSCGKPYGRNGSRSTSRIEIEIKLINCVDEHARYRCQCGCPDAPPEVIAKPVPRLVKGCTFGNSLWGHLLIERYMRKRPLRRIADDLTFHGLKMSPGTLAGSLTHMPAICGPPQDAILAHQNQQQIRHADETRWRIQSLAKHRKSQRAWLWVSVSSDAVCYHIDQSRSADAAERLFGDAQVIVYVVCDRYSAYKALAKRFPNIVLCYCWAHVRRDYIDCAASRPQLKAWETAWRKRISTPYRLNEKRLDCLKPGHAIHSQMFAQAQAALKRALGEVFATAERDLATPQAKPLRSLLKHREGLSVFVDVPDVPMDNNAAEREFRDAVIGRKLSLGLDSEMGAQLTAMMYSVIGTIKQNGLDVGRCLKDYLDACAETNGISL